MLVLLIACAKQGAIVQEDAVKTLLISQAIDFRYNEYAPATVFIGFDGRISNREGRVVKKVKLPQPNTIYRLEALTDTERNNFRWIVAGGSQIHTFRDSFRIGPDQDIKLRSDKRIQLLKIIDHMPQLTGLNSVRHSLQIENPNAFPVQLHFKRVVFSKSGREIEERELACGDTLQSGDLTKIYLKDYINSDLLSETVAVYIDSVFHI
ncbi:MAG: hypothetical protein ABIA75_11355 [Candidatus Neomarinimicrobiota bacterium]